jgi:hypothetical protein
MLIVATCVALGCQAVIGEDFSETQHYCFPFTSNGCAASQACVFAQGNKTPICATAGAGAAGDACTGNESCGRGTTCLTIVGDTNACRAYCHPGSSNECPANTFCGPFRTVDGSTTGLCFPMCDLTGKTYADAPFGACPKGQRCNETTSGTVDCFGEGAGHDGALCNVATDCADGFICLAGTPAQCRQSCKVGDSSVCPGSSTCTKLVDRPTFLQVEFGVCSP